MAHSGSDSEGPDPEICTILAAPSESNKPEPRSGSARALVTRTSVHLWDPLRLSKAQVFASTTTRSLSLSRTLSQSLQSTDHPVPGSEHLTVERLINLPGTCENSKQLGGEDVPENRAHAGHSVENTRTSCTSAPSSQKVVQSNAFGGNFQVPCTSVEDGTSTRPVKAKCLNLIDKIWKHGLDQSLDSIRHRRIGISPFGNVRGDVNASIENSQLPSSHNFDRCVDMKEVVLSEHGESMELSLGDGNAASSCRSEGNFESSGVILDKYRGPLDTSDMIHKHKQGLESGNADLVMSIAKVEEKNLRKVTENDEEESSNADSISQVEVPPPFKKARYSWQVKNKPKLNDNQSSPCEIVQSTENQHVVEECTHHMDVMSENSDVSSWNDDLGLMSVSPDPHRQTNMSPATSSSEESSANPKSRPNVPKSSTASTPTSCPAILNILKQDPEEDLRCCIEPSDLEGELQKRCYDPELSEMPGRQRKLEPSDPRQERASVSPSSGGRPERLSTEVYPSSHRRSTNRDFQMLTQALTRLDYVERWQCQHVAKALVDNAINKTLEEMGLSPDENTNRTGYREQRTRIEDAGVSQAILTRGLRRYSPSTYRMRRLNPIINRLTRVSEHLFSDNLRGSLRSMNEAVAGEDLSDGDGENDFESLVPATPSAEMFDFAGLQYRGRGNDGTLRARSEPNLLMGATGTYTAVSQAKTSDSKNRTSETTKDESESQSDNTQNFGPPASNTETDRAVSEENEDSAALVLEGSALSADVSATLISDTCDINDSNTVDPSSNFVLDQAMNAVILERGLQY